MNLRSATCRWTLPGGVRSSRSAPRWEDQRCRFYLTGTPESVTENAARSRSSNSVVGSRPCHRRQASARASSSVRAATTRRSRASGCSTFQCFRSGESVVTGTSPVGVPPARPRFGDRLHASHGPCPSVLCAASLRIRTGGLADVLSASGCIVVSLLVLVIVVTVRSIVVLYRESSPDYVARGAAARAVRRGVRRGEFRAPVTLYRPVERVSGAALTDSGGYRIKGGVSRAVRRTWVCIGSTCPIAFRKRLQRQLHGEVCGEGVVPPARWWRREGLSGAARSDSGGYRINGNVSRTGASLRICA